MRITVKVDRDYVLRTRIRGVSDGLSFRDCFTMFINWFDGSLNIIDGLISRNDKREILRFDVRRICSTEIEEFKVLLNRFYLKQLFRRIFLYYKLRNNLKNCSLLMLCIKIKIAIENFGICFVCILRHGASV